MQFVLYDKEKVLWTPCHMTRSLRVSFVKSIDQTSLRAHFLEEKTLEKIFGENTFFKKRNCSYNEFQKVLAVAFERKLRGKCLRPA